MYHFTLVAKKKEPLDIRNFDYSARSWTGKSPKQFLIDWCRKNFPKSPNPAFEKVPVGRYWKCRYVFPMIFSVFLLVHLNIEMLATYVLSGWSGFKWIIGCLSKVIFVYQGDIFTLDGSTKVILRLDTMAKIKLIDPFKRLAYQASNSVLKQILGDNFGQLTSRILVQRNMSNLWF